MAPFALMMLFLAVSTSLVQAGRPMSAATAAVVNGPSVGFQVFLYRQPADGGRVDTQLAIGLGSPANAPWSGHSQAYWSTTGPIPSVV